MKKYYCFFFLLLSPFFLFAQINGTGEIKKYKSLEIIFVDGSDNLTPEIIKRIKGLCDTINIRKMVDNEEIAYFLYVFNLSSPKISNYSKHWEQDINSLMTDGKLYETPHFDIDQKALLGYFNNSYGAGNSGPFEITDEVNIHYFFQPAFYEKSKSQGGEMSEYLNVLPKEIASLVNYKRTKLNVNFYVPDMVGIERIVNRTKDLSNFFESENNYQKTNIFPHEVFKNF